MGVGRHRARRGDVLTDPSAAMGSGPAQMRELAAGLPNASERRETVETEPVGGLYGIMAEQATNLAANSPEPSQSVDDLISNLQLRRGDRRNTLLSTVGVQNADYADERRVREKLSNSVSALAGYLAPSARADGFPPTYALRPTDASSPEAMIMSQELDGIVGARPLAEGGHTRRDLEDGNGYADIYTMATELDQVLMRTTRTHRKGPKGDREDISIQFLRTDRRQEGQAPASSRYADLPDAYSEEARARRRAEAVAVPLDTAEMQKYAAQEAAAEHNLVPASEFYGHMARDAGNWAAAWPDTAYRRNAMELADTIQAKATRSGELTMIRGAGHIDRAREMDARRSFSAAMRIAANQLAAPREDANPGPVLLYGADRPDSDEALGVTEAIKDVLGARPMPQEEYAERRISSGMPEDATVMATQWPHVYLYDVRERPGENSVTPGQQKLVMWRLTPTMGESMVGDEFVSTQVQGLAAQWQPDYQGRIPAIARPAEVALTGGDRTRCDRVVGGRRAHALKPD